MVNPIGKMEKLLRNDQRGNGGLPMNHIVHFDLLVEDPEKTMDFFSRVFGWEFSRFGIGNEEIWMIRAGKEESGIDGSLTRSLGKQAQTINTIHVPSVDEYLDKVIQHGGQALVPKKAIPGIGWFANCKDPCGLVFGIFEPDPSAK
jgi:uncharacterized protein